jgi:murein DD-endopeptidase MepM/ murein hydrolase activator NlpD
MHAGGVAPSASTTRVRAARSRPASAGRAQLLRGLAGCVLMLACATAAAQSDGRLAALRTAQVEFLPLALTHLSELDLERAVFTYPVAGRLSSAFGWRNIAVNGNRFHGGIDLAAHDGTPVVAARDGRVTRAGWWGTYGYVVVVDHGDGSETRYAHLSRVDVAAGANVRQGDGIGAVGSTGASTGPHLHFELRFDGRAVDPLPYLEGRGGD